MLKVDRTLIPSHTVLVRCDGCGEEKDYAIEMTKKRPDFEEHYISMHYDTPQKFCKECITKAYEMVRG